jgi:pyruvate/2-oxoglutarate dehydrogenase complex dihydrolipoamide dehydrogenase (E3) component
VVLGGGPIGVELAQCFHRLGCEVTLVQRGPRILPKEDQEVSEFVEECFRREGLVVATGTSAKSVEALDDGSYKLLCETSGGDAVEYEFDALLVALGRRANTKGFGLEELGVCLDESGTIAADDFLRTSIPNIYVCGDVAGPYQFTHFASHQAWYASINALFSPLKSFRTDYRVIPWCTFTDPEVARVGLNELDAKKQGIAYEVSRYGIDDLDRAIADSEAQGFVKVLTSPGKDKILGVTIVGVHAGDILSEFVLAMKYRLGLNKILGTIHIYPTLAEANKYVAGVWKRNNAPQNTLRYLAGFHSWRRGHGFRTSKT